MEVPYRLLSIQVHLDYHTFLNTKLHCGRVRNYRSIFIVDLWLYSRIFHWYKNESERKPGSAQGKTSDKPSCVLWEEPASHSDRIGNQLQGSLSHNRAVMNRSMEAGPLVEEGAITFVHGYMIIDMVTWPSLYALTFDGNEWRSAGCCSTDTSVSFALSVRELGLSVTLARAKVVV